MQASYFRAAVVRHPWRRFVSAYREKLIVKCKCATHITAITSALRRWDRACLRREYRIPVATEPDAPPSLSEVRALRSAFIHLVLCRQ